MCRVPRKARDGRHFAHEATYERALGPQLNVDGPFSQGAKTPGRLL